MQGGPSECERLQREIERLAIVCPAHAPTLMANAVIAYDEQRPAEAQQMLDVVLAQPRAYPDAAVLRARIAIEDGNIPFARRLLAQQIRLVPDHAGLHETHAAALYLDGNLQEATDRADDGRGARGAAVADRLSPGSVEETSGRSDEATRLYQEARHRESRLGAGGIASQGAAGPQRPGAHVDRTSLRLPTTVTVPTLLDDRDGLRDRRALPERIPDRQRDREGSRLAVAVNRVHARPARAVAEIPRIRAIGERR